MANDPPVKRHLNSTSDPCDLDFLTYRKGVRLRRFGAHLDALKAAHAISRAYQDVLDRREIFARHFGAKLKADALEETIRRAFTNESPQFEDPDDAEGGDFNLSWVHVVRNVNPKEIQKKPDGTYQCVIQGLTIKLSESDCAALQTGLLQKLAIPWPHQDDVQAELDTVASIVADLTRWDQIALQIIDQNHQVVELLNERTEMLKIVRQESLFQQAPSYHRTSAIMEAPALQFDTNQGQQTLGRDDVIMADQDGHTADISKVHDSSHISGVNQPQRYTSDAHLVSSKLQCIVSSPKASLVPWTLEEESRLLSWLSTHQDLAWPEKVKEYFCQFGIFRSVRTMHRKVRQLENRALRTTRRAHKRQNQQSDALMLPCPTLVGPNTGTSPQLQTATPQSIQSFIRTSRYTASNDTRTERDHDVQQGPYRAASTQRQPVSLAFLPVQPVTVPRVQNRHLAISDLCLTEASNTQPAKCDDSQAEPGLNPSELASLPVESLD